MGYATAGFDVIGVDIHPQPNYPFQFIQADWRDVLGKVMNIDAVHASPPCQAYSGPKSVNRNSHKHPAYIEMVRDQLLQLQIPFIIENVQQAPLRRDIYLCGTMFGRRFLRHRIFECSFPVHQPEHPTHKGRVRGWRHGVYYDGPYLAIYGKGGGKATLDEARNAMPVRWMKTWEEVVEAIPPCYTRYVGNQLRDYLEGKIGTGGGNHYP